METIVRVTLFLKTGERAWKLEGEIIEETDKTLTINDIKEGRVEVPKENILYLKRHG